MNILGKPLLTTQQLDHFVNQILKMESLVEPSKACKSMCKSFLDTECDRLDTPLDFYLFGNESSIADARYMILKLQTKFPKLTNDLRQRLIVWLIEVHAGKYVSENWSPEMKRLIQQIQARTVKPFLTTQQLDHFVNQILKMESLGEPSFHCRSMCEAMLELKNTDWDRHDKPFVYYSIGDQSSIADARHMILTLQTKFPKMTNNMRQRLIVWLIEVHAGKYVSENWSPEMKQLIRQLQA